MKNGRCAPRTSVTVFVSVLLILLTGCGSIGPSTISHDRLDYSTAIAESWKSQILLNLVKLRYMDTPVFLDVAQIVGGYTLQTSANVGGQVSSERAIQGNAFSLGAQGVYTDRPTITYMPLTGDRFLRSMLEPISPVAVFRMIESGYAADFVLTLAVENINTLRNRSFRGGLPQPADPDFFRVVSLMREIQIAGAMALRTEVRPPDQQRGIVMVLRQESVPDEILAKGREVRRLLKLPEVGDRFKIVNSPLPATPDELAVGSRSILQILLALATYVEAPAEDIAQKRAVEMPPPKSPTPLLRVRSSTSKPTDSFVAAHYRSHWFWVDDTDFNSKRTLTTIQFLFTLSGNASEERLPLLTIPTN